MCSRLLSMASTARLLIMWKMLAVIPSVICRIRRSDFGVRHRGRRSGVLRRIDATSVSNCSFAAHRLKVNCSNRRKLDVAADGLPRLVDAEAYQRDLQTIAEEAQRVQDDALLAIGSSEDVVHLVDDWHLHADGFHDPQCGLLHLGNVGARPLWRAEKVSSSA